MGLMGDLLYSIDPNTMILGLVFIILYVLIHFSLSKIFKKERASSAIISLCVSLLAVYGINRIDFDLSRVLFNWGVTEDILYLVVPWIILGVSVWASFVKDKVTGKISFRLYRLFLILGGILFLIGLITGVYENIVFIIIGIILILLGITLWFIKKVSLKKNTNPSDGIDILIEEARNFKKWALRQRNPKFYGGWTYFINYLHYKRGYPKGQKAICNKLGISPGDFDAIFNKYGLV
jgi:type IV secretory pathway VirB3-like protein